MCATNMSPACEIGLSVLAHTKGRVEEGFSAPAMPSASPTHTRSRRERGMPLPAAAPLSFAEGNDACAEESGACEEACFLLETCVSKPEHAGSSPERGSSPPATCRSNSSVTNSSPPVSFGCGGVFVLDAAVWVLDGATRGEAVGGRRAGTGRRVRGGRMRCPGRVGASSFRRTCALRSGGGRDRYETMRRTIFPAF